MLRRVDAEINHCSSLCSTLVIVFVGQLLQLVCLHANLSAALIFFFFAQVTHKKPVSHVIFFFSRLPPVVFMSLPLLPHFKQVLQQQRDLMKGVITFRNASRDWKAEYSTEIYCVFILNEIWSLFQIVEEEALIKNNNTCKDFLIEAMKYHLLPADQRHLIKTDRTRPRTPISIPKVHAEMCQSWRFLT